MAKPKDGLKPLDVVVHHDTQWWDGFMEWGEWDGMPKEDYKATHIDMYIGPQMAMMNPAVSSFYNTSDVPWAECYVLRLKPITLKSGVTVFPGTDAKVAAALHGVVQKNIGQPYDWSQIDRFVQIGLSARVDPAAAQKALKQTVTLDAQQRHFGVCSQWTEVQIETLLTQVYGQDFDLTAGSNVGHLDARPSDWTSFPMFEQVSQLG